MRRGQRYGTILCDLERHHAVDLLDERSAESFSAWLTRHPGVEVICRDRAGCYSQGANTAAPQAMQVADRWHLPYNLRDALVRLLDRHHRHIREAARLLAPAAVQRAPPAQRNPTPRVPRPAPRAQQLQHARRARRVERYDQVMELSRQGLSQRAIAKEIGLDRETVGRYIRADGFPERAVRHYHRRIDPLVGYLQQRWADGCRNGAQLTRELRAQGFDGSYLMVRRHLTRWRDTEEGSGPMTVGRLPPAPYVHPHVLVIVEVGYLAHSPDAANVLLAVGDHRYLHKKPMLFTTNKPLSRWGQVLHDPDLAEAITDRVLGRGRFIQLRGASYRTRHLKDAEKDGSSTCA